ELRQPVVGASPPGPVRVHCLSLHPHGPRLQPDRQARRARPRDQPRGALPVAPSRAALVLSPLVALAVTVAIATGEVRYRIPFDIFFIVVVCAFAARDHLLGTGPSEQSLPANHRVTGGMVREPYADRNPAAP